MKKALSHSHKLLLTLAGIIFIILGVIGVFLPVFPTTPFILCAAWCFARSNEALYEWLINHRLFGESIKNWVEGKPIPKKTYHYILLMMWSGLTISSIIVQKTSVSLLLITIGCSVSIYLWTKSAYRKPH